ncbi:MAG: S8 family serine peptidase [Bacteroidota bacterium]
MFRRSILCVFVSIGFLLSVSAQSKVSRELQARIVADNEAWQDVYIVLNDPLDLAALDDSLRKIKATPDERARTVVNKLRDHNLRRQAKLFRNYWGRKGVQNLQMHWISNVLTARVKPEIVYLLAFHPQVEQIIWMAPIVGDKYKVEEALAPASVGGREPGHDAIAAPPLWQMGYTGYGRKILIIDSGVDISHPALAPNYWGNYVPETQAWYHPNGSPSPIACDLHGTHVSGTAVGLDPAAQDTIGVAFGANWMASPAVGTNNGTNCTNPVVSVINALQWALDPDGDPNTTDDIPDVINNSWSVNSPSPGNECNSVFKGIFDALEVAGVAAVFSAGNMGPGMSTISSPKNIVTSPVNTFCVGMIFGTSPTFPIVNGSSRGPALCGTLNDNLFKPEVVAPGHTVRSSGLNQQYFNLTGTSMATPHVSGAILLLKEAFPNLIGTDLKYALYNSAVDLGAPGEDNTFGMGLINVKAAFDTLVAQGNVPIMVSDANDAALEAVLGLAGLLCDTLLQPKIVFSNQGDNQIDSLWLVWEDNLGNTDSLFWSGALAIGNQDTISLPSQTYSSGTYQIDFELKRINGGEDYHFLDNSRTLSFTISEEFAPEIVPIPDVCVGNEVLLSSAEAKDLFWYEDAFSEEPIAEGIDFVSPPLAQSTTYYAAAVQTFPAGKTNNDGDPGQYNIVDEGLWFNAQRPFKLRSVLVYSLSDGIRNFELQDKQGTVLQTIPVFLNFGPRRVTLDLDIPAGDSLRLGVTSLAGNTQLFSSTGSVSYPYQVPEVLSIIGSSVDQDTYPYCYDWEISYAGCRVEIPVNVVSGQHQASFVAQPDFIYLANGGSTQFSEQGFGTLDWFWSFGDGNSSTDSNPMHTYTDPRTYIVSLQSVGAAGCSDVVQDSVEVVDWSVSLEEPTEALQVRLFPNPTDGEILVAIQQAQAKSINWKLLDVQGKSLQAGNWDLGPQDERRLDLESLSQGLYLLRLSDGEQIVLLRVVKL